MKSSICDILRRHPDRVPVYVSVRGDIELERPKYLVPKDMSAGQFTVHVRNSMNVNRHDAVFMFVNSSVLPPVSKLIGDLYTEFAKGDGMLHITYAKENTFG